MSSSSMIQPCGWTKLRLRNPVDQITSTEREARLRMSGAPVLGMKRLASTAAMLPTRRTRRSPSRSRSVLAYCTR
jgi:hypothetical protein